MLKRSFISQGRRELLTPALTHHLRGHSASLRIEIPVFCLRASLRWLTHLRVLLTRTFLWPPAVLLHKGGVYSVALLKSGVKKPLEVEFLAVITLRITGRGPTLYQSNKNLHSLKWTASLPLKNGGKGRHVRLSFIFLLLGFRFIFRSSNCSFEGFSNHPYFFGGACSRIGSLLRPPRNGSLYLGVWRLKKQNRVS